MSSSIANLPNINVDQRNFLLRKLIKIEKENNIRILHAVVSGSRLFRLNSKNSDFDVKFIYVDQLKWYFNPTKKASTISFIEEDCDFIGFNMEKTTMSVIKSSGTLQEWIKSDIILIETAGFLEELEKHINIFFNPIRVFNYYNHVTRKTYINIKLLLGNINTLNMPLNFERRKALKSFFLFVRTSLSLHFCHKYKEIPINFYDLLRISNLDPSFKLEIIEEIEKYTSDENYCVQDIDHFNIMVEKMHSFNKNYIFDYVENGYISPIEIIEFHKKVVLNTMG